MTGFLPLTYRFSHSRPILYTAVFPSIVFFLLLCFCCLARLCCYDFSYFADHCWLFGVGIITFPTAARSRDPKINDRAPDQSRRHLIATAVIKDCTVTDNVHMPRSRSRPFQWNSRRKRRRNLEGRWSRGAGIMSRFKLMSIILFKVG